jgi:hypothetical protein
MRQFFEQQMKGKIVSNFPQRPVCSFQSFSALPIIKEGDDGKTNSTKKFWNCNIRSRRAVSLND